MSKTADILESQRQWLKSLQCITKRPILIKAIEGKIPEGEDSNLYRWLPFYDIWYLVEQTNQPIYTRGILHNEILIDPDVKDWATMSDGIKKVCEYCTKNNIPHVKAYSGGKGIHVSIFFSEFDPGEEVIESLYEYDVDPSKATRAALAKAIADGAGVDLEEIGIDWKKLNFNRTGKGSQIRTFGTTRAEGKYKTLVEDIPDHVPEPYELPLVFPEKVELWDISDTKFYNIAVSAIKEDIKKAEQRQEYNIVDADFADTKIVQFPCIKKLFTSGITNGRYYAGQSVLLMCKKCGYSREEAEQHMRELFKTVPNISQDDIDLRVNNALPMWESDYHFSCNELKTAFSDDFCNFKECPIKEKINEQEMEGLKNKEEQLKERLRQIPVPGGTIEKARVIKNFIVDNLAYLDESSRALFVKNDIKEHFEIETKAEIGDILKAANRTIKSKKKKSTKEEDVKPVYFNEVAEEVMRNHHIFVMEDSKEFFVYRGGVYVNESAKPLYLDKIIRDTYRRMFEERNSGRTNELTTAKVTETLNYIKAYKCIERDAFNKNLDEIAVRNGILNIRTRELQPHTPEKLITVRIDVAYDPKSECKNFDACLHNLFLPDGKRTIQDQVDIVYEWIGYCLLQDYPIPKSLLCIGEGGNGKGTVLNIMSTFLGMDNISNMSLQEIADQEKHRFRLAGLYGKLANICGDLGNRTLFNTEGFKKATGRDIIDVDVKYSDPMQFRSHAKLTFSINEVPITMDTSIGFLDRWLMLKFPRRFRGTKDENINIVELCTTDQELSGILNRALDGLGRVLKNVAFTGTDTNEEVRQKWTALSNAVGMFVEEYIESSEVDFVTKDAIFAEYIKLCSDRSIPKLHKDEFMKKFKKACKEEGVKLTPYKPTIEGERVHCFKGIKLKVQENTVMQQKLCEEPKGMTKVQQQSTDLINFIKSKGYRNKEDIVDEFSRQYPGYDEQITMELLNKINMPVMA